LKPNNILEIEDLCVRVGDNTLLDHVSLTIPDGEVHALLGQNGSGKTTLMMTIMGYAGYEITQGCIRFKGQDITQKSVSERAQLGIAIAQQRPPTIQGVTLQKIVAYILRDEPDQQEKLHALAQAAQMEPFLTRNINEGLSGGEIKRSELLQLLAMAPALAMMDEPDSGVDIEALSLVCKLINQLFTTDEKKPAKRNAGLIITHSGNILNQIHIDKAHVMHNGQIGCSGNPAIILEQIGKCGYEECIRCMGARCFS